MPLHHGDQPLEGPDLRRPPPFSFRPAELQRLPAGSVEKLLLELLGKVAEGSIDTGSRLLAESFQNELIVLPHPLVGSPPGPDRPLGERHLGIHEQARIAERLRADSLTGRTGTEMAVEGKVPGRQTRHRETGLRIAEIGGEGSLLPGVGCRTGCLMQNGDHVVSPAQRGLERIEKALTDSLPLPFGAKCQTIYHGLDRVLLCFEKFDRLRAPQIDDLAIDPQSHKSLASGPIDDIAELTRLVPDKRRQQHHAGSFRPGKDLRRDLLG